MNATIDALLPTFRHTNWTQAQLPTTTMDWLQGNKHSLRQRGSNVAQTQNAIDYFIRNHRWMWPQQEVSFISDVHADAHALLDSLVACGAIKRTGKKHHQFTLTKRGKKSLYVFGGDFFDKGPSNLDLLDTLKQFKQAGAQIRILAGNHDIRVLFGMRSAGQSKDPLNGHFFIRMGAKVIPLIQELHQRYGQKKRWYHKVPDEQECKKRLYPSPRWWQQFPLKARSHLSEAAIAKELKKIHKKVSNFEGQCIRAGITMRDVYAATRMWQQLFLHKRGPYYWFYKNMDLTLRQGSFLFLHAGIDDITAKLLAEKGVRYFNKRFKRLIGKDPFTFYYSPLSTLIRTKYRHGDGALSRKGFQYVHQSGISALVHGHRNVHRGQRLALRKNLLHFECDITLDCNSRKREGLKGRGAGATIFHPSGVVLGISSDFPHIKVLQAPLSLHDGVSKHG